MAVDPIIECFLRDLIPKVCQGSEFNTIYTASLFSDEFLHGHSTRSLPRLPLNMDAEEFNPTFLMSNIYIGLSLPKAFSLS